MRKAKPKKRILLPDPKFSDVAVTRFVNNLMLDGKKSIAYTIFYDSLELVGKKMKDADKSYGGSTGAQDFDFYEKPCPLLPQARR